MSQRRSALRSSLPSIGQGKIGGKDGIFKSPLTILGSDKSCIIRNRQSETWRRLKVRFPADIATHSTERTLYFDQQGLLKRHDYDAKSAAVHQPLTTSPISRSSQVSSFRRRGGSSLGNPTAMPRPRRWSSLSTWISLSLVKGSDEFLDCCDAQLRHSDGPGFSLLIRLWRLAYRRLGARSAPRPSC